MYFKAIYPNATILAFEPDKDAFVCLEENIKANQLDNIQIRKMVLSNREDTLYLYYDTEEPGSLLMSTIRERLPKKKQAVEGALLSNFIERDVDFLKMDVEGSEQGILEDLSRSGKLARIKNMAIEYHHHIVPDKDTLSRMLHLLEGAGFGYQIESRLGRPLTRRQFQDIFIYAYRRDTTPKGLPDPPKRAAAL
ncbi:MAG: FkbM family methyltransferase [Deltaproteobacteria bacterium]|nr:FkbM family methyltransferase [Deltaproteobacteria bacterium]